MLYPQNTSEIEILIITRREGLLTKIGHDLQLRVAPDTLIIDGEQFSGEVLVSDIEILGAVVGEKVETMSSGDKAKISKTIQKSVLEGKRHPKVKFSGTFGTRINLDLEIRNKKGRISLDHQDGFWSGILDHREFGVAQVKALLGTLKVNPILEVKVYLKPGSI